MSPCLGEQTHRHAKEERENHDYDYLQRAVSWNGIEDRRWANQKPNGRKGEDEPYNHLNAVFAD